MSLWRRARPLLSVVVPAYDVEDYLGECLDSLLAQTYAPLEVVVVDEDFGLRITEILDQSAAV